MSSLADAIKVAAALRGQQRYSEAIDLIERALAAAAPNDFLRLDANREGLRAAEAAGNSVRAKRFADAIAIQEPDDPEED